MELTIDQGNLLAALKLAERAAPTRPNTPILESVLLEADNDGLQLTATDARIGVRTRTPAAVRRPGTAAPPARVLAEYVGSLPSDQVRLSYDEERQRLRVECGRYKASIPCPDAADFPVIPPADDEELECDASELKRTLERVVLCAARDESRPVLAGVYLAIRHGELEAAAADGFRLGVARMAIGVPDERTLLVPAQAVREYTRLLARSERAVLAGTQRGGGVHMVAGESTIFARVIDGNFPRYEQIIPRRNGGEGTGVTVDRAALAQAVRAARALVPAELRSVRLTADSGVLLVEPSTSSFGESSARVPAEVRGINGGTVLNGQYVSEQLAVLDCERVTLWWTGSNQPVVFEEAEGTESGLAVIMPMMEPSKRKEAA